MLLALDWKKIFLIVTFLIMQGIFIDLIKFNTL